MTAADTPARRWFTTGEVAADISAFLANDNSANDNRRPGREHHSDTG